MMLVGSLRLFAPTAQAASANGPATEPVPGVQYELGTTRQDCAVMTEMASTTTTDKRRSAGEPAAAAWLIEAYRNMTYQERLLCGPLVLAKVVPTYLSRYDESSKYDKSLLEHAQAILSAYFSGGDRLADIDRVRGVEQEWRSELSAAHETLRRLQQTSRCELLVHPRAHEAILQRNAGRHAEAGATLKRAYHRLDDESKRNCGLKLVQEALANDWVALKCDGEDCGPKPSGRDMRRLVLDLPEDVRGHLLDDDLDKIEDYQRRDVIASRKSRALLFGFGGSLLLVSFGVRAAATVRGGPSWQDKPDGSGREPTTVGELRLIAIGSMPFAVVLLGLGTLLQAEQKYAARPTVDRRGTATLVATGSALFALGAAVVVATRRYTFDRVCEAEPCRRTIDDAGFYAGSAACTLGGSLLGYGLGRRAATEAVIFTTFPVVDRKFAGLYLNFRF